MGAALARWNNSLQTNEEVFRLKRRAILGESGRIFSRQGYHNTSLDDVAKALKVAKGTLYNYVRDKQEILFECHKMALDIGDRAFQYTEDQGGTGIERLWNMLFQYTATLTDEFGFCGILAELASLRPEDRKAIVARRDEHERRFDDMLRSGIADGSIRQVDTKLAICTFMGAINNLSLWYAPGGRLSNVEIAEKMTDILLGGLASNPAWTATRAARFPTALALGRASPAAGRAKRARAARS